jgi:hypothetical protein
MFTSFLRNEWNRRNEKMRRWNLPQVNTKVMCAVLTAAMVMTGFTACGGTTSAGTESAASESAEQKETIAPESTTEQSALEKSEEKVESYLGQITAIDGNVISIALAEKPEAPDGQKPEKDMLDEMTLTLSGDTMTITVNDDTIITIDGTDATPDDLQVGDTVSFFLDGEVVTSLSVGMPELTQSKQSMQAPEQK